MSSDLESEISKLRLENTALTRRLSLHSETNAMHRPRTPVQEKIPKSDAVVMKDALCEKAFSIVVYGASGDLAKKKTYPALFALFRQKLIPANVNVVGFARSAVKLEEFRDKLKTKILKNGTEKEKEDFVSRCYYMEGNYDDVKSYQALNQQLLELESLNCCSDANRLFYFAIPPFIYANVAANMCPHALSKSGYNRVIAEKPFGRDLDSYHELNNVMKSHFQEDQIYRIDHYLGKEMVQNLMVLRFANSIFEPLWNRNHISSVTITFKENLGLEGRGGYFDQYGIIRDVMQNHLAQILSLVAMEAPVTLNAEDIRDEKVKVLKAIAPLTLDRLVVGQFGPSEDGKIPGYFDDQTVPRDSIAPTFACAVLYINNIRWAGVPFILKCGKGLNERKSEVRVQFKTPPGNLYANCSPNELVLRVQPNEAIYVKLMTKRAGLESNLHQSELDLTYKARGQPVLYDAYERLILDTIRGDRSLFVRGDELEWSWKIFSPALSELEKNRVKPFTYPFGVRAPKEADELLDKHGFRYFGGYQWEVPSHL